MDTTQEDRSLTQVVIKMEKMLINKKKIKLDQALLLESTFVEVFFERCVETRPSRNLSLAFASSGTVNLQAQDLEGKILLDQPY